MGIPFATFAVEVSLMDQNKNQGQQGQGQPGQGQQHTGQQHTQNPQNPQNPPNPGQQQGSRDESRSNMGSQERGTGAQGEKNRSGISNRGMRREEEQLDLPSRGSSDDDSQSER